MGQKIILDSNILIYNANGVVELDQSFFSDNIVLTSVITEIEVLGYDLTEIEESNFENLFKKNQIIQIDKTIVKTVIKIRRSTKIGLGDAIIAATCIENEAVLMTANTKDFSKIPDLKLINPLK
jgi:toxin FitB